MDIMYLADSRVTKDIFHEKGNCILATDVVTLFHPINTSIQNTQSQNTQRHNAQAQNTQAQNAPAQNTQRQTV